MTHLNPEQLLDVADGTRPDAEFPHLRSCAACADQLADLRAAIEAAADVSVPEPSPLFWSHLSQRVRDAVAAEQPMRRPAFAAAWWQLVAAAAAVAALVIVLMPDRQPASDTLTTVATDVWQPADTPAFDDDPALSLLADLTYGMDWEATAEAGLVPELGTVDSVVFALSAEERLELHRLLQEALGGSGA